MSSFRTRRAHTMGSRMGNAYFTFFAMTFRGRERDRHIVARAEPGLRCAGALTFHQSGTARWDTSAVSLLLAEQVSSAICIVFTGRGVAQQHYMKSRSLLLVGALMLALVPVPAAASAQRGSGRHHGGRAIARPLVIVRQPVAVRPTVVVVQPVVVRRPIIGRSPRSFGRSSLGSIPVRMGFGRRPVRTGFGTTTSVRTGFGVEARLAPVPVTIGRRHGFKSKDFRAHKPGRVVGGTIVVGYPVPYWYTYPPPYGVTTSSAGHPSRPSNITVYGADGVSAGLSTYSVDLVNDTSASGGLNFEVSPADAEVYVGGMYMGTVQDFSADDEPLRATPGSHRIELRAPGYRTSTFDVSIVGGQATLYQGALKRLRPY